MTKYQIKFSQDGLIDLEFFAVYERKTIVDEIKKQLSYQPAVETSKKKKLRNNVIAPWELKIGTYRAFYEVLEDIVTVYVVSVGYKEHNILYVRGREVRI
jgi:mRNA interferase RelE/StbE